MTYSLSRVLVLLRLCSSLDKEASQVREVSLRCVSGSLTVDIYRINTINARIVWVRGQNKGES